MHVFNPSIATNYAKALLIGELMAIVGRSLDRATDYKRELEGMTVEELACERECVWKEAGIE